MNVLSLFTGIGGIDLGLQRAGMTVVGQVEIDPWCRRVLTKHWPEVPKHDDVRTCVDWWGLGADRPAVDVVAGGFPCQPVSNAGRRLAQEDDRWLWPAMADVIRALRPRWVLLENTTGLLSRGMGDVLGDLSACGYDSEWDCIPASAVGAPHRRDRVWIVAYPHGTAGRCTAGDADTRVGGTAVCGGPPEFGRRGSDVADAAGQRRRAGRAGRAGRPVGGGADRKDEPTPGMADPEGIRRDLRPQPHPGEKPGQWAGAESGGGSTRVVADADSPRRDAGPRLGWSRPAAVGDGWWEVEPPVGRVADGIPGRVDQLRGYGNAVVPQVVEHIGNMIMQWEGLRT